MTDRAATLTYFAMMSLFPALLVGVTLLGLFGQQGARHRRDQLPARPRRRRRHRERSSAGSCRTWSTPRAARSGVTLVRLGRCWPSTARRARSARPGRALNVVYGVEESRGMVRRKLTDLATTLVVIVLFAVVLAAIFLGGQIADDLFGKIGLGSTAATIWSLRALAGGAASRRRSPTGSSTASRPTSCRASIRWITPGRGRRRRAVDRAVARLLDLHPQLLELRRGLRRLRARRSCCCCGSTCRPTPSCSAPSSTPSSSARGATGRRRSAPQPSRPPSSRSVSSGG